MLVERAEPACSIAKRHKILAQQSHAYRRPVAFGDFLRQARGYPVTAHQLPHRCVALDPAEQLVLFWTQHGSSRPDTANAHDAPRLYDSTTGNNIRSLSK